MQGGGLRRQLRRRMGERRQRLGGGREAQLMRQRGHVEGPIWKGGAIAPS